MTHSEASLLIYEIMLKSLVMSLGVLLSKRQAICLHFWHFLFLGGSNIVLYSLVEAITIRKEGCLWSIYIFMRTDMRRNETITECHVLRVSLGNYIGAYTFANVGSFITHVVIHMVNTVCLHDR